MHDEEDGTLCVLVTLDSAACAQRYGFRDTDRIVRASDTCVLVQRGAVSWTLCCKDALHHHNDAHPWSERGASVANMVLVDPPHYRACVPNAPSLMLDAVNSFDPHHWNVVDERNGGLTV